MGHCKPAMVFSHRAVRIGVAGAEGMFFSAKTYSRPSVSSRRTRSSAATPHLRAKPWAALVALPSASKAMFAAGPRLTSWTSSVAVATSATSAARRRGLEITRTSPWARPASSRPLAIMVPSCLTALFSGAEGISSVPISNRKSLASAMAYATSPSWSAFSLIPATSAI